MTAAESVFSLHTHAMPCQHGCVGSGSLQENQKTPEGQNQKLIRCAWGTRRRQPPECNVGEEQAG